ncbi:DUF2079 domain-containing protein [Spirulina major CS-329]|uniref:DUF2079 domain-containing protein n=1 Tax=Spirulina TaxID=1154 RepID=UPI002330D338|nr:MULTISPECIES: DUF2079 domain-containing protein [Spirulina]MDB9494019.1 DUF2079 domain-containing protein [Spirulina subsalsa CS-330]MDB9502231.1 DUF2079 domain-containing protein [Spirulina major CS-329]
MIEHDKNFINKNSFSLILLTLSFLCITAYSIFVTSSQYQTGYYHFHDLGLINDWITNAIKGNPFYVTDYDINHLGKHFTPSLLILFPFYLITNSQYILIFFGCLSMGWIFLESTFLIEIYSKIEFNYVFKNRWTYSLICLSSALFTSNSFVKTNLISGHFEIFAIPLIIRLTRYFMLQKNDWIFYVLLLLTLGIRQDVGLFLTFLLIGTSLKLSNIREKRIFAIRTLLIIILISIMWLFISVKVIMPFYSGGSDTNIGLWQSWGSTYPEIIVGFLTHPMKLLDYILNNSAATDLFKSFGFIFLIHPLSFVTAHIPSILIYTMDRVETRELYWYNSAFLIPSCLVFSLFSVSSLLKWVDQKSDLKLNYFFLTLLISLLVIVIPETHASPDYYIRPVSQYQRTVERRIHNLTKKCIKNTKISSDLVTFVYLPLSSEKFLLRNWKSSDLIIFNPIHDLSISGLESGQDIITEIKNDGFEEVLFDSKILVYYRPQSNQCSFDESNFQS